MGHGQVGAPLTADFWDPDEGHIGDEAALAEQVGEARPVPGGGGLGLGPFGGDTLEAALELGGVGGRIRVHVGQPEAPALLAADQLDRADVRAHVGGHHGIGHHGLVLLCGDDEVAVIRGLGTIDDLRHVGGEWGAALLHQHVGSVHQVGVDGLHRGHFAGLAACMLVLEQARLGVGLAGETDDHAVHRGLARGLGVPREGAVGELDPPAGGEDRGEQAGRLVPLHDRVRRHERPLPIPLSQQAQGQCVPGGHEVQAGELLAFSPGRLH